MTPARRLIAVVAVGLAGLATVNAAGAQSSRSSSRLEAFTGCWRATSTGGDTRIVTTATPVVCVVPAANDSLQFLTVAEGKIVARNAIDASGREVAFTSSGCTGQQSATWSSNGRRLYLKSVATCNGGVQRSTNGLFAISPAGEWLDVQGVTAGEGSNVRVTRYTEANNAGALPAEVTTALGDRSNALQAARIAAGAPVNTNDVTEVVRTTNPSIAEAWLLERHQQFVLDAGKIAQLADAGLPPRVIDAMVAVSYPRTFAVAHPDGGAQGDSAAIITVARSEHEPVAMDPYALAPYNCSYYGPGSYISPSCYDYGPYGYSPYGYGAYGYSPYAYGGFYTSPYGYRPPIIILSGSVVPGTVEAHARAEKGKGYTRDTPPPGTTGSRSPAPAPSSTSGTSGSQSSGAAASSSSGNSSTGRTAHPKSP
jgi:hypothetical protein